MPGAVAVTRPFRTVAPLRSTYQVTRSVMSIITPFTLPDALNCAVPDWIIPRLFEVRVIEALGGLTVSDSRPLMGGKVPMPPVPPLPVPPVPVGAFILTPAQPVASANAPAANRTPKKGTRNCISGFMSGLQRVGGGAALASSESLRRARNRLKCRGGLYCAGPAKASDRGHRS